MTTTITQRPTVHPQTGDIQLHGRQGFTLSLSFIDATTDAPRDVTGAPIFFEVADKLRVALEPGDSADERLLVLTREDVATIFGGTWSFALVDESGSVPDVPYSGRITTFGFKDQPE